MYFWGRRNSVENSNILSLVLVLIIFHYDTTRHHMASSSSNYKISIRLVFAALLRSSSEDKKGLLKYQKETRNHKIKARRLRIGMRSKIMHRQSALNFFCEIENLTGVVMLVSAKNLRNLKD